MPTPRPADAVGLIPGGVAGEVQPVGPAPCVGGAAQRSGSELVESPLPWRPDGGPGVATADTDCARCIRVISVCT